MKQFLKKCWKLHLNDNKKKKATTKKFKFERYCISDKKKKWINNRRLEEKYFEIIKCKARKVSGKMAVNSIFVPYFFKMSYYDAV